MAGRRLALLIATSSYDDAAFSRLRAPDADIEALRGVLADPTVGGYAVDVLSNAASHEVNQAIEGFFAEAKLDDLVLLYFSGHGFKNDAGRLYLITRESRQRRLDSTAVSAQFVRDQLDRCRSRRKVVILDCCYAGAFPPGATRGAEHVDVLGGLSGRGCAVITASSAVEYAFEDDGSSSEVSRAEPSVFTGALIEGLATGNADVNGDGLIDIDELYDHVYKRVKDHVNQQTPGRNSQLEGTLYVATSPRGPQPMPLPLELKQAIRSPLASSRFGVVKDLIEFCDGAHPGTLMTVHVALSELAEDDSIKVSKAANSALETVGKRLAEDVREVAQVQGDAVDARTKLEAARGEAAKIIDDARREADQLLSAAGLDVARLRINAERDNNAMMDAAQKERDELLSAVQLEVGQLRAEAQEKRAKARAILEQSEARVAEAEAEFERRLAARREEAERQEAERLAAAQAATIKLVNEAEQRAFTAEERAAAASAQADQIKRDMIEAEGLLRTIVDLTNGQAYGVAGERLRQLLELIESRFGRADHSSQPADRAAATDASCPECGVKVQPEDLICFRCGTNLLHSSWPAPPETSPAAARFPLVRRGYLPHQVDEFLSELEANPTTVRGIPGFDVARRGYDRAEVDAYIRSKWRQLGKRGYGPAGP